MSTDFTVTNRKVGAYEGIDVFSVNRIMAESDGEIEFLDEDADVVQQCLGTAPVPVELPHLVPRLPAQPTPLLTKRLPSERTRKRKRKDEEDSDYDPNDDISSSSPPSSKGRKKKQTVVKKLKKYHKGKVRSKAGPSGTVQTRRPTILRAKQEVLNHKQFNIRIPNYDDPLCLPVRAVQDDEFDVKRLNNWNNVCLEHFKYCDTLLKPEIGEATSSTRTMVFRHVTNKESGEIDTAIWSKTSVENEEGDKKSEIFQCVLPHFQEKSNLPNMHFSKRKPKPFHVTEEVILSKEDSKEGELLVAYKPKEASSAVYKLVTQKTSDPNGEGEDNDEYKMYAKELTYCKMCAACFQKSWRGTDDSTKEIICPICRLSFANVHNLLGHFKTHSSEDIQKYKKMISLILGDKMNYHYKCRICQDKFISIKKLRLHLSTHRGTKAFKCQVCNKMVR